MRVKTFISTSMILTMSVATAESQSFKPGTIAVLPFGVRGEWRENESAWASSLAIAIALKDVLSEGQRFTAVLDRSGDAVILDELMRTESVWNSGSAVQVAQDGQLNANYVAYGFIMRHTYDAGNHCARIEFTVEISDVGSGEAVMSKIFKVDNDIGPGPITKCVGSLGSLLEEVSEATAFGVARDRVSDKVRDEMAKDFGKRFGYRLLDMRQRDGVLEVLFRASEGDPKRGTEMVVLVTVTSAFDSTETYTQELGRLKVRSLEGDVAIAQFENQEQADAFVAHVNEHGPRSIQVKRR